MCTCTCGIRDGGIKKFVRGAGGGGLGATPFLGGGGGGGCRMGLLRLGLCKSPSFACGVPAACHTRAWDAGDWTLSGSLSLNRRCFKVVLVQSG